MPSGVQRLTSGVKRLIVWPGKSKASRRRLRFATNRESNTMKCLFFIISLLSISLQAVATCSYSKTGGGAITVSFNGSVIADSTLPNGSILASARRGSVNPKTFSSCSSSDVYVVRTVPVVSPSNIIIFLKRLDRSWSG